ncbi:MAG: hypothetical protein U0793_06725 [Gemmataceae bacterium]
MNWEHFKAVLALRWRLTMNQARRGGVANMVVLIIVMVVGVLISLAMFTAMLLIGLFALDEAGPGVLMLVWDGLVVAMLFFWMIGLVAELQRAELLSLDKFLHLPVSLRGVFFINYVASWLSLSMIVFLPAMIGLTIGLAIERGPAFLVLFPLVGAFLFMVTALTYQLRGWLAALMANKRRRRTVIMVVTLAVVLLSQTPQLINLFAPWRGLEPGDKPSQERSELEKDWKAKRIDDDEYARRGRELDAAARSRRAATAARTWRQVDEVSTLINMILPPGWLPYGARAAAEDNLLIAVLPFLGMTLIGGLSLKRSYKTTVRLYRGEFSGGTKPRIAAPVPRQPDAIRVNSRKGSLLEWKLPWVSEHASAIALAGFRSLLRAPEARMVLLTPFILAIVFGSMFVTQRIDPPVLLRPLMAFGGVCTVLLTMIQVTGNQFGFDRSGFRSYVLCPAPRRDILLGKNIAAFPMALVLSLFIIGAIEVFFPMPLDLFLALFPQLVSVYLIYALLTNLLSILAPMAVAAGSLRPTRPKGLVFLLHLAFTLAFPILAAVALAPLGIVFLLEDRIPAGAPLCLALSLVEAALLALLYRLLLGFEGNLLAVREQAILEVVTTKTE